MNAAEAEETWQVSFSSAAKKQKKKLPSTRTHHIKRPSSPKTKTKAPVKPKSVSWREIFKEELEKYGEAGLMLRGSRHKAGLTQRQLADVLKISQNHISEMEHGKRPIGKVMALRMAKFFKTDYRKFL